MVEPVNVKVELEMRGETIEFSNHSSWGRSYTSLFGRAKKSDSTGKLRICYDTPRVVSEENRGCGIHTYYSLTDEQLSKVEYVFKQMGIFNR